VTRGDRALKSAATLFAVAVLFHGADHVRRGPHSTTAAVFWVGTSAILLEVSVVVLCCQRHRVAPLAATVGGFSLSVGYLVVHFLPRQPLLSDSFVSAAKVSWISWLAATLEVVSAVVLGVVGLVVMRDRGGLASAAQPWADELTWRRAVSDPVALGMIAGNVAILVVSGARW